MPYCLVLGCRSGYGRKSEGRRFFMPPKEKDLFAKWVRAIPLKDGILGSKSKICDLHFSEDLILKSDRFIIAGGNVEIPRFKWKLKPGAVPHIFPNVCKCLLTQLKSRKPHAKQQNQGTAQRPKSSKSSGKAAVAAYEGELQGLLRESSKDITCSGSHEVLIKEEPCCPNEMPTAIKCEELPIPDISSQKEMLPVSVTDLIKSKNTMAIHSDCEVHFKIEIKDELHWLETSLNEISHKSETPLNSDVDFQDKLQETASHSDEIAGEMPTEAGFRLHTESLCKDSNTTSCFFTSRNSGGNAVLDITEVSQLLNFSKPQVFEGLANYCALDSEVECCSLIETQNSCEICGKSFPLSSEFKKHGISQENQKPFKCEICEKSYTLAGGLERHKIVHEGIIPYTCDICEKSFTHVGYLKRHKVVHQHTCEICKKHFTVSSTLKQHKLIHEGKKPHTCEICGKSFTKSSNLKQHKLTHEGIKPYKCDICEKNFSQLSHLKTHKLIHKGEKLHQCEICNKSFIQLSTLRLHQLTHEGKKPHTCNICKKSFTQSSTMKRHKLTHEGKRPYVCEICNKGFICASYLKQHKLIHEGIRPYTCEVCNKSFSQMSNLRAHKLIHEGKRPHTCEICSKGFTQISNLKKHKLTHQGKRPHTCEICNKSFTLASDLKMHKLIHESKKQCTCEICNKSFIRAAHLKQHKLIHKNKSLHKIDI